MTSVISLEKAREWQGRKAPEGLADVFNACRRASITGQKTVTLTGAQWERLHAYADVVYLEEFEMEEMAIEWAELLLSGRGIHTKSIPHHSF